MKVETLKKLYGTRKVETLTINSPVSTVCAASLLLGLVYLDMRYVKRIHIQTFHLEICQRKTYML